MFNRFISSFFHPIIYPLIASVFYLFTIPRFISIRYKLTILTIVFVGSYLLPILFLFLFKKMHIIKSFHLKTIEERKFSILFFAFLSVMLGKMLSKLGVIEDLAVFFIAGGLVLIIVYGFLWLGIKVSIHTLGIGALIGFVLLISRIYKFNFLLIIALLFILFAVVARARILLKAHTFNETLWGLFLGMAFQVLIPYIYQNI